MKQGPEAQPLKDTLMTQVYRTLPHPPHHITTHLLIVIPFTHSIMPGYQERLWDILKGKKLKKKQHQFEETVQASEPDMSGMLEFSDQKFQNNYD